MVAFSFNEFSGSVVSDPSRTEIDVPSIVEFTEFDSSQAIKIVLDTKGSYLNPAYELISSSTGRVIARSNLPCGRCSGEIEDIFIITEDVYSGRYNFVFYSDCQDQVCPKIVSPMMEVKHV